MDRRTAYCVHPQVSGQEISLAPQIFPRRGTFLGLTGAVMRFVLHEKGRRGVAAILGLKG